MSALAAWALLLVGVAFFAWTSRRAGIAFGAGVTAFVAVFAATFIAITPALRWPLW